MNEDRARRMVLMDPIANRPGGGEGILGIKKTLTRLQRGPYPNWKLTVTWALIAVGWLAAQPFLSLLHELAVLVSSFALNAIVFFPPFERLVRSVIADPIYTGVALEMVGNTHPRGLAIAGPVGEWFNSVLPGICFGPDLVAEDAWFSAVVAPGSSDLSQLIVVTSADVVLIICGVLVVRHVLGEKPWRHLLVGVAKPQVATVFGLLLQAYGALAIISIPNDQSNLEHVGLAHLATKILMSSQQVYETQVLPLVPWLFLVFKFLVIAGACATAVLLSRLIYKLLNRFCHRPRWRHGELSSWAVPKAKGTFAVSMATICVLAILTPLISTAETNFEEMEAGVITADSGAGNVSDAEVDSVDVTENVSGPAERPTVVTITGGAHRYVYRVNGRKRVIRGIGYNVNFRKLPIAERGRHYERDFSKMKEAGMTTILGWGSDKGYRQDNFDELTLRKAQEYGLGVFMPYSLPPDGDYSNREFRTKLKNDVLAWVAHYKDYPAVRMWAVGNEVFHGMSAKDDPDAFARFYLDLADAVHTVDPNHPVIYRDAENLYITPLRLALAKSGIKRPWLAYGMNIFTFRISSVLEDWGILGLDQPLVISEFGPASLSAEDRPNGLVNMWREIYAHRDAVLGGFVYAWTTDGPEPMDRVLGLVNENGNPIDGAFEAIAAEFTRPGRARTGGTSSQ